LSDLRGVKFRAVTPTARRLAQLIGADPVEIRVVGVRQAFASGEVTAMLASPTLGIDTAAWEYARYFYPTNAAHPRDAIVVNDRAFHRLPEDIQTAMLEVAGRAEHEGWRLARLNAVEIKRTFAEHGLKVVEPSIEMMREFRAVGRAMADEWVKRAGPDGEAIAKALSQ
jgi:TRAP-type C4-dicarboxylate transport system substrate-binding protein